MAVVYLEAAGEGGSNLTYEFLRGIFEKWGPNSHIDAEWESLTLTTTEFFQCFHVTDEKALDFYSWLAVNFEVLFVLNHYRVLFKNCLFDYIALTEVLHQGQNSSQMFREAYRSTTMSLSARREDVGKYSYWLAKTGRDVTIDPYVFSSIVGALDYRDSFNELKSIIRSTMFLQGMSVMKSRINQLLMHVSFTSPQKQENLFKAMGSVGLLITQEWRTCLLENDEYKLPDDVWELAYYWSRQPIEREERVIREVIEITNTDFIKNVNIRFDDCIFQRLVVHADVVRQYLPAILRSFVSCSGPWSIIGDRTNDLALKIVKEDSLMSSQVTSPESDASLMIEMTHVILERGNTAVVREYHNRMGDIPVYINTANNVVRKLITTSSNPKSCVELMTLLGSRLKIDYHFLLDKVGPDIWLALVREILRRTPGCVDSVIADHCFASVIMACADNHVEDLLVDSSEHIIGPKTCGALLNTIWRRKEFKGRVREKVVEYVKQNLHAYVEVITAGLAHNIIVTGQTSLHEATSGTILNRNGYLILGSRIFNTRRRDRHLLFLIPSDGIAADLDVDTESICSVCHTMLNNGDLVYHNPKSKHGVHVCAKCMSADAGDALVECIVCFSTENTKILHCNHICCRGCIKKLTSGKDDKDHVDCPLCRAVTGIITCKQEPLTPSEVATLFCDDLNKASSIEEMKHSAEEAVNIVDSYPATDDDSTDSDDDD